MDAKKHPTYRTLFGGTVIATPVVVSVILPRPGENEFQFHDASETIGKTYWRYLYRYHPKASAVAVHVYGESRLIEYMAKRQIPATCSLEIVEKTTPAGKKQVFLNLVLAPPRMRVTHTFGILPTSKRDEFPFYFTTDDMHGIGIGVSRL